MPDEDDLCGLADGELLDRLFPDLAGPIGQWYGLPLPDRVAFGIHSARGKLELYGGRLWKLHSHAHDASRKRCDAATAMLRQDKLIGTYQPDPLTKAQVLEANAWDGLVLLEKFAYTAPRLTVVAAPGVSKAFAQKIASGLFRIRMPDSTEANPAAVSGSSPAAITSGTEPADTGTEAPPSKTAKKLRVGRHEEADKAILAQVFPLIGRPETKSLSQVIRMVWKQTHTTHIGETDLKRILTKARAPKFRSDPENSDRN